MCLTIALVLIVVFLSVPNARAQSPIPDGKWLLSAVGDRRFGESKIAIFEIETKGNKPTAKLLSSNLREINSVKEFKISDKEITIKPFNQ